MSLLSHSARDLALLAYFDRTLYEEIKRLTGYIISMRIVFFLNGGSRIKHISTAAHIQ